MVHEVLAALACQATDRVLDCTLGLGGHALALIALGVDFVGVDRDPVARSIAAERLAVAGGRYEIRAGTFAEAAEAAIASGEQFDAVLADLGVSSMQIDDPDRGFSMRSTAPADMRMGDGSRGTAMDLIDRCDETELADIIYRFGEERASRPIARLLKLRRREGNLHSTADIAAAVRSAVRGHAPRHPALRTLQALRIAVNDELGELDRLLELLPRLLSPGGRAAVISFHSLEDRAVKTSFRAGLTSGIYGAISRSVVIPTADEMAQNPRSASAKLRWARR